MNLWVSRVRQLAVLAVALFFYSCVDDANLIGFKNPNSKFEVKFKEFSVKSSVLLDSMRSSNFYNYNTETNRLLVGKYTDAKFGEVSSSTCTQFFTTTPAKLKSTARFDSVSIQFRFDYYTYGNSKSGSPQIISIYELSQPLDDSLSAAYFNSTRIPINLQPSGFLGSKSFNVDPTEFKGYVDAKKDTAVVVHFLLGGTSGHDFGQRIFDSALKYRDATSQADSTFINYREFIKEFYGIAIVPNDCDKMFGFSPSSPSSKITLHYTVNDTLHQKLDLAFNFTAGYNNIVSDRGGVSDLNGIQYHQDFEPTSDNRYIQSGIGISTKIDISEFSEWSDTIPNMIINSAELYIGSVENEDVLSPPSNLVLRVLKEDNKFYKYQKFNGQSVKDYTLYNFFINPDNASGLGVAIDNDSTFTVIDDRLSYFQLNYSKSGKKYNGYLTRFLQELYNKDEGKTKLTTFALNAVQPTPVAKTVNRVVFPKDDIKLRVYYTVPTIKN